MQSSLEEIRGVKFLYLRERDPYERGRAHGSLLREEIRAQAEDVSSYVRDRLGRVYGRVFIRMAMRKANRLRKSFSPAEESEMKGIAEGSDLSFSWVLLFNSIYEIAISFRDTFVGCSFFAAPWKESEKVVIGKTIDLYFEKEVTDFITKRKTVFVYRNGGRTPYLAPSLPGCLATDSVITEEGTLFAVNDGGGAHKEVDFTKTPIVSIVRDLPKVSPKARIWLSALKKVKTIRPFACLLSGGEKTNTYLLEMCQGDCFVGRMNGIVVNTNHFLSPEMREKWYVENYEEHREYRGTLQRRKNIEKKIGGSISSLEEALEVMEIHEKTFDPKKGSVANKGTVQAFVFHPSENKILFPAGEVVPVTFYGKWHEFSFDKIFERL